MADCPNNNTSISIGGIPVSGHSFEEYETYKNVTVQILRCKCCGEYSIAWKRQDDTEVTEYDKSPSKEM